MVSRSALALSFFFFQAEDGIRDVAVTGVQTCALPISHVFDRLLTPAEAEYCRSRPAPAEHVAVRLAAKEAVYKALQGSDAARGIGWRDIEVTRAPDGRPDVALTGLAERRARELRVKRVLLSLSHTHEEAVAIAVLSTD